MTQTLTSETRRKQVRAKPMRKLEQFYTAVELAEMLGIDTEFAERRKLTARLVNGTALMKGGKGVSVPPELIQVYRWSKTGHGGKVLFPLSSVNVYREYAGLEPLPNTVPNKTYISRREAADILNISHQRLWQIKEEFEEDGAEGFITRRPTYVHLAQLKKTFGHYYVEAAGLSKFKYEAEEIENALGLERGEVDAMVERGELQARAVRSDGWNGEDDAYFIRKDELLKWVRKHKGSYKFAEQ